MLLIQENPNNFTLLLSAADQVIVGRSENASFQTLKIPEPPISGTLTKGQVEVINKEKRTITCMGFSKNNEYLVTTTENKQLVVFDKSFQVIMNIIIPRVSSKVCFTPTNDLLVADRTGDVYLYKLTNEKQDPQLLLGHLSVILDMLVTDCGKYIITCDRDEKIRVSHYPNAYNIITFCLGHVEFVTSMKLVRNVLFSGSGDGTVRMWNYLEGKQVNIINTNHLVDKGVLDKFSTEMDSEKVDITVLPVTHIQIHEAESKITLAISLYSLDKLFLYSVNPTTLHYDLRETVLVESSSFSYYLSNKLFVLSNSLNIYEFLNGKSKQISHKVFEEKLSEYKELFTNNDSDITLLYKRKFDNVQEYLERKKLRMESK